MEKEKEKYLYKKKNKDKKFEKRKKIKIPKELEKEDKLLDELLKIITGEEKIIRKIKEIKNKNKHFKGYVFTNDNFVKMYLLIMRIRAQIPTIIMGETGCGKTKLLQMFSFLYNFPQEYNINNNLEDFSDYMWIFRFNSGTTEEDVIKFINDIKLKIKEKETKEKDNKIKNFNKNWNEEHKKNLDKYNSMKWYELKWIWNPKPKREDIGYDIEEEKKEIENTIKKRKIIIVFDEINTCNCLGFIKLLLCDEYVRKKYNISERFIFICTCNPYRFLKKEEQRHLVGYILKNAPKRELVYTVNPLPFSLLNFVFDFGDLPKDTTEKYIEKMVNDVIGKNHYFEIIIKLLIISHFFIKDNSDSSSVSLREIDKYGKIYKFFLEYLKYRNDYDNDLNLSEKKIQEDSIILSLYFCYYLKLPTSNLRNEYLNEIKSEQDFDYIGVYKRECDFLTNQVLKNQESRGIAKNDSLKNNLFCIFVCVVNKEPLIICGKAGTSKSLSLRLIIDAMKGEESQNKFFKKYEEVIPIFYQCSLASTSKSVQKLFNRAKEKIKTHKNQNILISMDEMGIADASPNNPLKVLHAELDINSEKDKKEKFSFIGITNYFLDASKMNRANNNVIEDLNENNILECGLEIASSLNDLNEFDKKIIEIISKCYRYYVNDYQPEKGEIQDFHGSRDYYNLIKNIFNNNKGEKQLNENNLDLVFEGLYRNFGGQEKSIEIIKKNFLDFYQSKFHNYESRNKIPNYNVMKCINDNLNTELENLIDHRYLLLITENEICENILKNILKGKKYIILSIEDFNSFESLDIISLLLKIQIYMEQEIILILKNLEIIYPSLYELCNKSFSQYLGEKKYTRISYENKHTLVYVNDKFRMIFLIDRNKLNEEDKPFLNRFEKHIFYFEKLLSKDNIKISDNLYDCLNKFIIFKKNVNKNNEKICSLKNHLFIKNKETLRYLTFSIINENNNENDNLNIRKLLLSKIVPLFAQEMIYLLKFNTIENLEKYEIEFLLNLYKENQKNNYNIKYFLTNLKKENKVNIIYTFSKNPFSEEENKDFIKNNFPEKFNFDKSLILDLNNDKILIIDEITNFIESVEKNLLIVNINNNINEKEKHLLMKIIKKIDEYLNNTINSNESDKYFIFIIYKNRNINYENENKINNCNNNIIINNENIDNNIKEKNREKNIENMYNIFLNFNQQFIDNLNGTYNEFYIQILTGKKHEIIDNKISFEKIIDKAFDGISFKVNNEEGYNLESIINNIREKLKKNEHVLELIKTKLKKYNDEISEEIYSKILLGDIKIEGEDNFCIKINKLLFEKLSDKLKNLMNYLEKDLSLSIILDSSLDKKGEEFNELINDFKENLDKFSDDYIDVGVNIIFFGFKLFFKNLETINISSQILSERDNDPEKIEANLCDKILGDSKLNKAIKYERLYLLLYKDYLNYFAFVVLNLKINAKEKKEKVIDFLDKILQKGCIMNYYKKENKYLKNFSKIIIFLNLNKKVITNILCIFLDFINIIPNFTENFIENLNPIQLKDKKYDLSKMIELIFDLISVRGKFRYFFGNDKDKYIDLLKQNLLLLQILSKEINNIFYIKRIEIFIDLVINDSTGIIEWILKQNRNIEEILAELTLDELTKEKNIISKDNDFISISNLFFIKYQISNNEDKTKTVLNFISNENLLKYSIPFFKMIFLKGEYFNFENDNFFNIFEEENKENNLETKINELLKNNNILIEFLIFYFEIYYENYYFETIEKESFISIKDKYTKMLGGNSLENLSKAFEFYERKYTNEIKTLKLLNCVGYIKSYFKYFSNILFLYKNDITTFDFTSVDKKLNLSKNNDNYIKNVLFYIFEIIFLKCQKNDDEMKSFIEDKNIYYLKSIIDLGNNFKEIMNKYKDNSNENYFRLYYDIPSLKLLKEKLDKNKNPVLNWIVNNMDKIYKLNRLNSINLFTNKLYNHLSCKFTKDEISKIPLKEEKKSIKNFDEDLIKNFIDDYNSFCDEKNRIKKDKYDDCTLDYFVIDKKNFLYEIYEKLIEYQNEFLLNISKKKEYETYIKNIEEIYIQDANDNDVPRLNEKKLLDVIINYSFLENKETNFNFDMIEKKLIEETIPGIKKFISGDLAIRQIIYKGKFNTLNNDILYDFQKKMKSKILNKKQEEIILGKIKGKTKNELLPLLLSIQSLMMFILSKINNSFQGFNMDSEIIEPIKLMEEEESNIYSNEIQELKSLFKNKNDNLENYMDSDDDQNDSDYEICHLISVFYLCKEIYEK